MSLRSEKSLESLKFFPFIAWSIFLLFAAFVYALTYQLKEVTVAIGSSENDTYSASFIESTRPAQTPPPTTE